jgi:uncharacterized Zn-finger protein
LGLLVLLITFGWKRLKQHEYYFKNERTCSSWKVLENNNYDIFLLEEYKCETRKDLLKREAYFILKNRNYINRNNCVNIQIPGSICKQKLINNLVNENKNIVCIICNNKYKTLQNLKNHYNIFHRNYILIGTQNNSNNICEYCNKIYSRDDNLKRHYNTCKNKKYMDKLKEMDNLKAEHEEVKKQIVELKAQLLHFETTIDD